jgi:hypothetical protein
MTLALPFLDSGPISSYRSKVSSRLDHWLFAVSAGPHFASTTVHSSLCRSTFNTGRVFRVAASTPPFACIAKIGIIRIIDFSACAPDAASALTAFVFRTAAHVTWPLLIGITVPHDSCSDF